MWGRNPENNRAGTLLESHCDSSESVAIHSRFRTMPTCTHFCLDLSHDQNLGPFASHFIKQLK